MRPGGDWLVAAAVMSAVASALHVACIAGGPSWYRFLGAGERMAQMAEQGSWRPAVITAFIAAVLAGWAVYASSGAGLIGRLPLLRAGLIAIAAILLARAAAGAFPGLWRPDLSLAFKTWSSVTVCVMGLTFAIGTAKAWPHLNKAYP